MEGLFRRYFAVSLSILFLAVGFLSTLLLRFVGEYANVQNQKDLDQQTEAVVRLVESSLDKRNGNRLQISDLTAGFAFLGDASGNEIILVDTGGHLLASSDGEQFVGKTLSHEVTQAVRRGEEFFSSTNLKGYLSESKSVSARACMNQNGEIYAYLFVAMENVTVSAFLDGMRRFFLLNVLIVMAIAYLVSYYLTKRMAQPLRQIARATNSFAKGDFSVRVPVGDEDDLIGQLAISFNEMADALSKNEQTRSSFVANISHDLRTPMTTIGGFIDGILDGTIPPEKERYYLKIVSDEVKRLSRLVVVMMNVAKIEAGEVHLNLSSINFFDTTCSMLFSFEQRIEEKKIKIELEEDHLPVSADADLINQVIYNLIDNAVKFTPEGGAIRITFKKDTTENMGVMTITNTGEGISQEDISRIFDRFYKSDRSRGLDKNGVGLGLYIVKSIVDAHRGSISVSSVKGESTSFRVSLPLAKDTKKRIFMGGQSNE